MPLRLDGGPGGRVALQGNLDPQAMLAVSSVPVKLKLPGMLVRKPPNDRVLLFAHSSSSLPSLSAAPSLPMPTPF